MAPALREPLPPPPTWSDWQDRAEALGLRNRSGELVGPCPSCGGEDRFHVRRESGGKALAGCRGCIDGGGRGFGAVHRTAFPERFEGRRGRLQPGTRAMSAARAPATERRTGSAPSSKPRDTTAAARRVWDGTRLLAGTLAETYLTARGVGHVAVAPALRFSPALKHPNASGRYPCLVAGVQDVRGGFAGVHRIYLDREGGKADVDPVKASLGSVCGGAVRLAEPAGGRLLVGEGIESTAAGMLLFNVPGWAALGALPAVEVPEHVREVLVAADRDADGKGQLAATALDERLEADGREVVIELPPFVGDWNDVLREAMP